MATAACLIPWLRRASFSPAAGVAIETHHPQAPASAELFEEAAANRELTGRVAIEVDDDELVAGARALAAGAAVQSILSPLFGEVLADCEWHLYIYDSDVDRLLPIFEPDSADDSEGWAVGQGATGMAYLRREFVLVVGDEASDGTYSLTPAQQARYSDLTAVAAMPVQNASGDVVAVLSAAARDSDTALVREEGFQELLARAVAIGRVLIDLLRWFGD
jgi:hypothetical protein